MSATGYLSTTGDPRKVSTSRLAINLAERGLSHTNSAANNTSILQQAVVDGESAGRPLQLPWVPNGSWIDINDSITVANGGIALLGAAGATRIRQNTFPRPVFDIFGSDVTVDGFVFTASAWNASAFGSTFRGEPEQSRSSSVLIGADRVAVRNVAASNFIAAVHLSNWGVVANQDGPLLADCNVENVRCANVAFGLLVRGVDGFSFHGIRGSYQQMPGSGLPPHLVYFTDPTHSTNVTGSDCYASGGNVSFAYQFKYLQGASISNLVAKNCYGFLHLMECYDAQYVGLVALGDTSTDTLAGSIEIETTNQRVHLRALTLTMSANGKAIRIGSGAQDCSINEGLILTNHTAGGVAGNDYDVDIQGTSNTVRNLDVRNLGATAWGTGIGIWAGTGSRIIAPKGSGNKTGALIRTGATGSIIDYDLSEISIAASGVRKIDAPAVGSTLTPRHPAASSLHTDRLLAYDRGDRGTGTPSGGTSTLVVTTSGHAWIQLFGTFETDGSRIRSTNGVNSAWAVDVGAADIDLSAGIKYQNREFLPFRFVVYNTFLAVRLNHTTNAFEIYKKDTGTDTTLATTPATIAIGRRYRVFVRAYSDRIEAGVDGTQLLTYTLSAGDLTTFGTQTRHGIGGNASANGWFDNIEWRSLA